MGKKGVPKERFCQKREYGIHGQRLLLHFLVQFFPIVAPSSLLPPPFSLPLQKQKQRKTRTEYTGAHLSTKRDKCRGKP